MCKKWKGKANKELIELDIGQRDFPCILNKDILIIGTKDDTHSTLVHKMLYGMDSLDQSYEGLTSAGLPWTRDNVEDDDVAYGHIIKNKIYWDVLDNSTSEVLKMLKSNKSKTNDYEHFMFDSYKGNYNKIKSLGRE
ncbi:MAG: hypothetical protein IMY73_03350 [Bacteroidetes bacterium]|nr:hypothetical protein [Bacteroidota bacterium]